MLLSLSHMSPPILGRVNIQRIQSMDAAMWMKAR